MDIIDINTENTVSGTSGILIAFLLSDNMYYENLLHYTYCPKLQIKKYNDIVVHAIKKYNSKNNQLIFNIPEIVLALVEIFKSIRNKQ